MFFFLDTIYSITKNTIYNYSYSLFLLFTTNIGIKKFNITIEFNNYKFHWSLPILLIINPKH